MPSPNSAVPDELVFDTLDPIAIPIVIKSTGKKYFLKEASGETAVVYNDLRQACLVYGPDPKGGMRVIGIKDAGKLEPLLVARCLFDDKNNPVPEEVIRSWPAQIQKKLFTEAKRISFLEEKSPERDMLEKALLLPGSPVTPQVLYEYVGKLDEKEYRAIRNWLIIDQEASVKNSQGGTEDGSA